MSVRDNTLVVQFPHPGREHGPDVSGFKGWNHGRHRRKFLKSAGTWRHGSDLNERGHDDQLVFWGEWEPPSRVTALPNRGGSSPHFLHEPFWTATPDQGTPQNTDPFVFGDRFLYSNCRQGTKQGPLKTKKLGVGSTILFGSTRRGHFVLDTVFVVSRAQSITAANYTNLKIDRAFDSATLSLLFPRSDEKSFRLYEGATPTDPIAGMFSFFPCMPKDAASDGFPRPSIELEGIVNGRNTQALKFTKFETVAEVRPVWETVVNQVIEQGLVLGVRVDIP